MSITWNWTDARDLCVEGRGWQETDGTFDHLPSWAKGRISDVVWELSRQPAGVTVRFESDACELRARWEMSYENLHTVHCPLLAHSGLDLYARIDGGGMIWEQMHFLRPYEDCLVDIMEDTPEINRIADMITASAAKSHRCRRISK